MPPSLKRMHSTIHANNCEDALFRLDSLMASSTHHLPFEFIQQQVRRNIDVVVYQEKTSMGRKVLEITEVKEKCARCWKPHFITAITSAWRS